jgi:hypothetical protein
VAVAVIEAEAQAQAYLRRLHADMAHPDELAALMGCLSGDMLHGACRVIEKALREVRHA